MGDSFLEDLAGLVFDAAADRAGDAAVKVRRPRSNRGVGRYSEKLVRATLGARDYCDPRGGRLRAVPQAPYQVQGAIDLYAVCDTTPVVWARRLAVQVKTAPLAGSPSMPRVDPPEWNELWKLSTEHGWTPILAVVRRSAGLARRGGRRPSVVEFYRITGPKDRPGRPAPMTPFELPEVA